MDWATILTIVLTFIGCGGGIAYSGVYSAGGSGYQGIVILHYWRYK